jgi:peptidoglycan hydrolase CwlO-like protein
MKITKYINEESPAKFGVQKKTTRKWNLAGLDDPMAGTFAKKVDRGAIKAALNRYNSLVTQYNKVYDEMTGTSKEDVSVLKRLAAKANSIKNEMEDLEKKIDKGAGDLASGKKKAEAFESRKKAGKQASDAEVKAKNAEEAAKKAKMHAKLEKEGAKTGGSSKKWGDRVKKFMGAK